MKKYMSALGIFAAIFSLFLFASSCSQLQDVQLATVRNAKPDIPECAPGYHWDPQYHECVPNSPGCANGYHWDPSLNNCVPDCPPGYYNDPTTGACVVETISVITNPNNPYDYAGADHNNAVATIFPTINPSSPNVDSVIEAQVENYAETNWEMSADSIQMVYDSMKADWNVPPSQFPRLDSLGNDLYAEGKISMEANNYVQQIYSIANQYLNIDTLTEPEYENFANNLITIENQISQDNELTESEDISLLTTCSIARYSAEYWGNYINGQSSASVRSNNSQPQLKLLWKVLSFVVSDAEAGLVWGSEFPPVTTITAVACAVVSVYSSVSYAAGE